MSLNTPNTFVQCSCGRDVAIKHLDEVRICACGKMVQLSNKFKYYIIAKKIEHKKDSEINIEGLRIEPVKFIKR